jgi:hypothetical protein
MTIRWNKVLPAMIAALMLAGMLAACATPAAAPAATSAPSGGGETGAMDELVKAAQAEGTLTTIALPHDWCNYGEAIDTFKAKYGIEINELNPDGGSGDEIEAIKANQGNTGPQAPDVIDVGFTFGEANKDILTPYKVATWDSIPDSAKSADGYWYGDYYGVMAFLVNTDVQPDVPQDWADLLDPKYKGQVALAGRCPARFGFLRQAERRGQLRPGHLEQRLGGQGRDARPSDLGLQRVGGDRLLRRQSGDGAGRSGLGPLRRRVCPGHQQVRSPSECCQAVAGVPVLG